MNYSRLRFSHWADRAVAISGLEKRLIDGFNSRGGFGILDDRLAPGVSGGSFLHRSLLWHRSAEERSLARITFPPSRQKVPTWSWMAYQGGIEYLELPFDEVKWEEIRSPWQADEVRTVDRANFLELRVTARTFELGGALAGEAKVVYDMCGTTDLRTTICIVIGVAKGEMPVGDRTHYVLFVASKTPPITGRMQVCERVGVGHLPGKCIGLGRPGVDVRIR